MVAADPLANGQITVRIMRFGGSLPCGLIDGRCQSVLSLHISPSAGGYIVTSHGHGLPGGVLTSVTAANSVRC
jgi:hypothetical protein